MRDTKPILLTTLGLLASASMVFGGGNTSVVHLSEVHSVKVEAEKVTIIGSGYVEFRVMTDREPAASSVFGQPAQLVRAKTTHGTFEIIPYYSDPEIKGIPTRGHDSDELKRLSAKWWKAMAPTYASVRSGDSVTISYQQDRTTILEYQVESIIGAGSLAIHSEAEQVGQSGAAQPTAAAPGSGSDGGEKPKPNSEGPSE